MSRFFKDMHSNFDQSLKLSVIRVDSPSQVFSFSTNIKWCCIHTTNNLIYQLMLRLKFLFCFYRISLSGNYIRINCRNAGVYQYHVHFSPSIDSKNMRFKLVNNVRDVIGFTKAFDGFILYLPHRLQEQVSLYKRSVFYY